METSDINIESLNDRDTHIAIDSLTFAVTIKGARIRFGHLDLLVSPKDGRGEKWVEHHKVIFPEDAPLTHPLANA